MTNLDFDVLFNEAASNMYSAFLKSAMGGRPDEIGLPRENKVKNFFKDWMPNKYGVSKGYLIDLERNLSKECDLVIFDNDTCPKFYFDKELDIRFFPKSEIYGFMEVKSKLGERELTNAIEKIESAHKVKLKVGFDYLDSMSKMVDLKLANYNYVDRNGLNAVRKRFSHRDFDEEYRAEVSDVDKSNTNPLGIIFAYTTEGRFDLENIRDRLSELEYPPQIVCILDQGILVEVSIDSMRRYQAIETKSSIKEYGKDYEYSIHHYHNLLRENGKSIDYIKFGGDEKSKNLMLFYIFIMDYLSTFKKYEGSHIGDFVSVWRS